MRRKNRRFLGTQQRIGRTMSAYDRYYNTSRPYKSRAKGLGIFGQFNQLSSETKKAIFSVLSVVAAVIMLLALFDLAGAASPFINKYLGMVFGVGQWYLPVILLLLGYFLARSKKYEMKGINHFSVILLILGLNAMFHTFKYSDRLLPAAREGLGGGFVGIALAFPLLKVVGYWATLVILLAIIAVSLLLFFNTSPSQFFGKISVIKSFFSGISSAVSKFRGNRVKPETEQEDRNADEPNFEQRDIKVPVEVHGVEEGISETPEEKTGSELDAGAKKWKAKKIDLPLTLLNGKAGKPTSGDIKANQLIIKKTLENFGIEAEMGEVNIGPTITQFTLKPAEGIKLSRIVSLNDNLALALASHPIRIEAPIPGRSLVGIEVPNQTTAIVPLREVIDCQEFKNRKSNLMFALGKDVKGQPWLADIARMPHILIAGSTGSGKSVCINTLIVSLLYQNGPADLRFVMIDPKRVELPVYNGIPHLITPVITDVKKTINALKWCITEMENRFDRLSKFHKRDIKSYNRDIEDKMPYIVVIIDEMADLMASSGAEVEGAIIRLAQMSRAVGIHLVLATQRPSVDILTGLIKANIPCRVAFSVASLVDSRTILDQSGAEKLIGRGDMLYLSAEISKPKRLQGALTSDEEIKRITDYLKEQSEPEYVDDVTETAKSENNFDFGGGDNTGDPLLPDAREVIIRAGKASASLLQRRLRVGYARAARILDLLEEQGIIGPSDGAKPRDILMRDGANGIMDNTKAEAETADEPQDVISEENFEDIEEREKN